jgi:hypothetical protein
MKLPFNTILTDMAGNQIVTQPATDDKPAVFLTLKDALLAAFSANHADDERLSNTDRYAMGKLGFAIGKETDLSVEDVAKIKERVGKVLTPGLVFQVYDLIESAASLAEVAQ